MITPEYAEPGREPITLDPYVSTNWKTAESRDAWSGLLDRAAAAKDRAEWRSVMDGRTDRRAAIIHVNNYNREEWLERVGEHGLVYRPIRYSKPYDGFAHEFYPTDVHDLERNTYAVVAEDEEAADEMERAELELEGPERHDRVGELLGFPACCRSFFNEAWLDRRLVDPMYEISCNTPSARAAGGDPERVLLEDPNPGTNVMWRYFGWSFLTHMPCSWECEESAEIARSRYEIMAEHGNEEEAAALAEWLDTPFVWSGYHAIATVKNAHLVGSTTTSGYWSEKRVTWREEHPPAPGTS